MHPGRIVPSCDSTVRIGGRHIFWLGLRPLLLRVLMRLLLIGLPVLPDGVRRVDVERGRRVKVRSRSSRKRCYRVRE